MPKFRTPITSAAAVANGNAIASIVPGAAANGKVITVIFGIVNAGGTVTDFEVAIGVNRGTARGTASTTLTPGRSDPNSAASAITGIDSAWSVQPTLAAQDLDIVAFNSRSNGVLNLAIDDLMTSVGTANPIVFVNRSGAALPANHSVAMTIVHSE